MRRWAIAILILTFLLATYAYAQHNRGHGRRKGQASVSGSGVSYANNWSLWTDGVDDRIIVGDIADLENATKFQWSYWIKYETLATTTDFHVSKKGSLAADTVYLLFYYGSTNQYEIRISDAVDVEVRSYYSYTYTQDLWTHHCTQFDGGGATNADKLKHWVNGVQKTLIVRGGATIPSSLRDAGASFSWGSRAQNNNPTLAKFDEVATWKDPSEFINCVTLYAGGEAIDLTTYAPDHWWRTEDAGGSADTYPTIIDRGFGSFLTNGTMTSMSADDIVEDAP